MVKPLIDVTINKNVLSAPLNKSFGIIHCPCGMCLWVRIRVRVWNGCGLGSEFGSEFGCGMAVG